MSPARLAPSTSPDTQFFWDGLKERRLLVQRCDGCGTLRHPPRPMCPRCHSLEWTAIESSGRGTILSAVVMRHPQYPWWFETDPVVTGVLDAAGDGVAAYFANIKRDEFFAYHSSVSPWEIDYYLTAF